MSIWDAKDSDAHPVFIEYISTLNELELMQMLRELKKVEDTESIRVVVDELKRRKPKN